MAKKAKQHVIPHDGKWAVKRDGSSRVTSVHDTQREAIDAGREIARNQGGELVIHGRDGEIRERDSIVSDPRPPIDRASSFTKSPSTEEISESLEIMEDQELDEEIRRDVSAGGYHEEDAIEIVRRYRREKNNQRAAT
jgi:hypothetical protein